MYFMMYSLENIICNFSDIFTDPFIERACYNDIIEWFIVYLIFDLINMAIQSNKRIDLYIHHIWCLGTILIAKGYNSAHSVVNLTLIAEAISIVSGIDLMAMEDNNMKESYYYKLYRKNIIRYLRLPLWIIILLVAIRHTSKFPTIVWYNCIFTSILMWFGRLELLTVVILLHPRTWQEENKEHSDRRALALFKKMIPGRKS